MTGDRIALVGLRGFGRHGVLESERHQGQEFVVDLTLGLDLSRAAASDALADTVDYGQLAQRALAIVEGEPVALLEALAARVADACLTDVRVDTAEVTVHKPHAPIPADFADVAVTVVRTRRPRRAALGLGANLGDRLAALRSGLAALVATPGVTLAAVSPVYETAAIGPPQPDYLNAVAVVETTLAPRDLLDRAHGVEAVHGRDRGGARWGPRTLDVDLLAVDGVVSDDPACTLPHPRAAQRGFVLAPWADVDPAFVVPGAGAVAELLTRADLCGVRRRDDLSVLP